MIGTAASMSFQAGTASIASAVSSGQAGTVCVAGVSAGDISTASTTGLIVRY